MARALHLFVLMMNSICMFKSVRSREVASDVNCHWLKKFGSALLVLCVIVAPKVQAQSVCETLFSGSNIKPEMLLFSVAASHHYAIQDVKRDEYMREGLKEFLEIVDPLELVFTQTEYDTIVKAPSSFLAALEKEVFASPKRTFLESLRAVAQARYEILLQKFFHSDSTRNKILNIIKDGKIERTDDVVSRVAEQSQIEDKLAKVIGRFTLNIKKAITDSGREISNAMALKYALKNLKNVEEKIRWSMDTKNLPLIIAKSFISALDPHSNLLIGTDTGRIGDSMASSWGGVGTVFGLDQNGLQIMKMVPNGPAENAGIQVGDVITHVSTAEIREKLPKLVKRKKYWYKLAGTDAGKSGDIFRGEVGQEIHVKVLRNGQNLEMKIARGKVEAGNFGIAIDTVKTAKGTIAHVKLASFFQDSQRQLRDAILNLKRTTNLSGMILDLRHDGGGSVPDLVGILGLFVYPGSPGIRLVTNEKIETLDIPETSEVAWDGPLIVLTDSQSASASEGLSGALKDYGRAIIVGDAQTYGKGTAQFVQPLGPDAVLTLTFAMLFTPSGRSPQIDGVASDIVLKSENTTGFEKDYPHVIAARQIAPTLPSNFSLIGNREGIISELTKRSEARRAGKGNLTEDQNTAEAYKIMEDFIGLTP